MSEASSPFRTGRGDNPRRPGVPCVSSIKSVEGDRPEAGVLSSARVFVYAAFLQNGSRLLLLCCFSPAAVLLLMLLLLSQDGVLLWTMMSAIRKKGGWHIYPPVSYAMASLTAYTLPLLRNPSQNYSDGHNIGAAKHSSSFPSQFGSSNIATWGGGAATAANAACQPLHE